MNATRIPDPERIKGFRGDARLYRLDPPLTHNDYFDGEITHEYVVVSAANDPYSGPETYIFPADEKGNVTSWGELTGSQRGTLDHEAVLSDLGYTIQAEEGITENV